MEISILQRLFKLVDTPPEIRPLLHKEKTMTSIDNKAYQISIERKILDLDRVLFNEAAKPPYEKMFRMTDLGNLLFAALEKAGLKPLFRAAIDENPIPFSGIEINVPILKEKEQSRAPQVASNEDTTVLQLIDERDEAEQALSQAYYLVIGRSPEWSNVFGRNEALDEIKDACELLRKSFKHSHVASNEDIGSPVKYTDGSYSREYEEHVRPSDTAAGMSHQSECERGIRQHYKNCPVDIGAIRSAYGDAAHLCDAIAKDFVTANRTGKRKPRKEIMDIANQIMLVGNAIFALRDKINEIEGGA